MSHGLRKGEVLLIAPADTPAQIGVMQDGCCLYPLSRCCLSQVVKSYAESWVCKGCKEVIVSHPYAGHLQEFFHVQDDVPPWNTLRGWILDWTGLKKKDYSMKVSG